MLDEILHPKVSWKGNWRQMWIRACFLPKYVSVFLSVLVFVLLFFHLFLLPSMVTKKHVNNYVQINEWTMDHEELNATGMFLFSFFMTLLKRTKQTTLPVTVTSHLKFFRCKSEGVNLQILFLIWYPPNLDPNLRFLKQSHKSLSSDIVWPFWLCDMSCLRSMRLILGFDLRWCEQWKNLVV